jgi:hypothetical protein
MLNDNNMLFYVNHLRKLYSPLLYPIVGYLSHYSDLVLSELVGLSDEPRYISPVFLLRVLKWV